MNIFCYQHNIEDFRRDTEHLTHEQKGVYRALLDAYYFRGGNLPDNLEQLGRIISVHSDSERSALAYAVANYFKVKSGKLIQKRADEEIAKIQDKSIKAKASANAKHIKYNGNRASVRTANGHANGLLTKNYKLRTSKLAGNGDICESEILPAKWQDVAEARRIPEEQIFASWRKFKDRSAFPYQLERWAAWVENERIR